VSPVLFLSAIRKSFDGFPALDGAEFAAEAGEVHALLGENGAGKSSLMNVAAGFYAPDAGVVRVDGVPVVFSGPAAARAVGIGMVHQHFKLVARFTIAEAVLLANPRGGYRAGMGTIREEIADQAARLGITIEPDRRIETLSVVERQRVEIVKVLVGGARILILDEPTAVLTDEEAERLLSTLRRLAATGTTVILVTHKLREVRRHADRVTIMRGGRTVARVDPRGVDVAALTRLTVGETTALPVRAEGVRGDTRLNVAGLTCVRGDGRIAVEAAEFSVRGGEIYGVAGVSGNGQDELAAALTGAILPRSGEIWLEGPGDIAQAPPAVRRAAGLAAIPVDRMASALAAGLGVADNFGVGAISTGRYGGWGRVDRGRIRRDAAAAIAAFDVQGVRRPGQKAALLSGGNAQKLVFAREFSRDPRVVIVHGPSRGLDARACAMIHARLLAARDGGAALVLISDDLDEVLALSDRIGVLSRGRIVAEFGRPADRQAIGRAMVAHG
jgi:simple sugar transport system ATP-binding protein